jgi:hypothetical protein
MVTRSIPNLLAAWFQQFAVAVEHRLRHPRGPFPFVDTPWSNPSRIYYECSNCLDGGYVRSGRYFRPFGPDGERESPSKRDSLSPDTDALYRPYGAREFGPNGRAARSVRPCFDELKTM